MKSKTMVSDETRRDAVWISGQSAPKTSDSNASSLLGNALTSASNDSLDRRVLRSYRLYVNQLPFWRRMFSIRVSIPLPIAAGMAIAVFSACGAMMLLGRDPETNVPSPANLVETVKVEVPVTKERIVPRLVYRDRHIKTSSQRSPRMKDESLSSAMDTQEHAKSYFTTANLVGFQPNRVMSLTVLKGAETNEK